MSVLIKPTGANLINALADKNISRITFKAKDEPSEAFKEVVAAYGFDCLVCGKPGKYTVELWKPERAG
jgi:hypothetical protein